jgi:tight adherence protein B
MAAGLTGPSEAYVLVATLLAAGTVVALLRVLADFPLAAVIGGVLALYAPWVLVGELARRRAHRFEQQLLDVIDFTAGSLQAGGSVAHALHGAASAAPQPLRGAFEESFRAVDVGMPLDRAIERLNDRFASEGVRLFTVSLAAKLRAGGDLVPMLRAMSETLRDRWRQQRHIRAQLAGARLTAAIVVVLPYVLALVLLWMSPGWFDVLFADPIGPPLLFVAVLTQIIGTLWLWRILAREA